MVFGPGPPPSPKETLTPTMCYNSGSYFNTAKVTQCSDRLYLDLSNSPQAPRPGSQAFDSGGAQATQSLFLVLILDPNRSIFQTLVY